MDGSQSTEPLGGDARAATVAPVLRPTAEDMHLSSSIVLQRVKRQLQHILPDDDSLDSTPPEVLSEHLLNALQSIGEAGLFRIAELFRDNDANHNGRLDWWEIEKMLGELSAFMPGGHNIQSAFAIAKKKPLTFLDFADLLSAARAKPAGADLLGTHSGADRRSQTFMGAHRAAALMQAAAPRSLAAVTDEALSLIAAHGRPDGTIHLLEFRNLIAALDLKYGWGHSIAATLQLFRRCDEARTGALDLTAIIALLRQLHGLDSLVDPSAATAIPKPAAATVATAAARRPASLPPSALSQLLRGAEAEGSALLGMPSQQAQQQPSAAALSGGGHTAAPSLPSSAHPSPPLVHSSPPAAGVPPHTATGRQAGKPGRTAADRATSPVLAGDDYRAKYYETLMARAQSSIAQRDALQTLPEAELRIVFDEFERVDTAMSGMLTEAQFLRLWPSLRKAPLMTVHRGKRVAAVCILLPSLPHLTDEELEQICRESDDANGNLAGQGLLDVNEVSHPCPTRARAPPAPPAHAIARARSRASTPAALAAPQMAHVLGAWCTSLTAWMHAPAGGLRHDRRGRAGVCEAGVRGRRALA